MERSLEYKLKVIRSSLNTDHLFNKSDNNAVVKDYYKTNRWSYRLFHNWAGFLYMGISNNSIYKKTDLLVQVKTVEEYISKTSARNVLELGSGQGANSFYLSQNHPTVTFSAIDLSTPPLKKYRTDAVQFSIADYNNLSSYNDETFEVIFAIETLCHSNDKGHVLSEVYRKLKPGGIFIIFDGYLTNDRAQLNSEQKFAATLIEKGMAVDTFEDLPSFRNKITGSGFTIVLEDNLSLHILPTLYKFERMAKIFFRLSFLQKLLTVIIPEKIIRNSLSGYLMPNFIEEGTAVYIKHVLQK